MPQQENSFLEPPPILVYECYLLKQRDVWQEQVAETPGQRSSSCKFKVIFSDEASFDVTAPRPHFVRRQRGACLTNDHTIQRRPFLQRVMVWGAMSWHGVNELLIVEGKMKTDNCIGTLQAFLIPKVAEWYGDGPYTFEQDTLRATNR